MKEKLTLLGSFEPHQSPESPHREERAQDERDAGEKNDECRNSTLGNQIQNFHPILISLLIRNSNILF